MRRVSVFFFVEQPLKSSSPMTQPIATIMLVLLCTFVVVFSNNSKLARLFQCESIKVTRVVRTIF